MRPEKILFSFIALATAALPVSAQSINALISGWQDANEACRGSSDPAIYEPACKERDTITALLLDAGLCEGQYQIDSTDPAVSYLLRERWIPCIYGDLTE